MILFLRPAHGDVEAIHRRGDEAATVGKDIFLGVVLIEDCIEVVVLKGN